MNGNKQTNKHTCKSRWLGECNTEIAYGIEQGGSVSQIIVSSSGESLIRRSKYECA